ncbi:hypothetical protein C5167_025386 [Papaver somniferum]|uniref:Pollen Ole e 1 allergen and extensin family protein n=1 Tax=Papaver somniferum TaxID=3469 RepID=A0A4Y7JSX0_PAPSO|nr:non-classical arabinogalactan protein 30-like [Papaver somniferum]RZC63646.1 hypothetical protein C5167_025386 [Papaver somniferum]
MALSKVIVSLMLLISLGIAISSEAVVVDGYPAPKKPPVVVAPASAPKTPPVAVAPASAPIYYYTPSPIAVPPTSSASPPVYLPIRRFVAVQGVVFAKPCADFGHDTLMHSVPLPGAMVKMVCHGKPQDNALMLTAVTDENGYFFIPPTKKVSEYGAQKRCRVFLHSPPATSKFQHSTHMNGGLSGAYLRRTKPEKPLPFVLYTVGPFAYEPLPSVCHQKA